MIRNRKKWLQTLGEFAFKTDFDVQYEPFFEDAHSIAKWVYITLAEGLRARFVLALPKKRQPHLPLVIAQHGFICSPENVFGLISETLYHNYGNALLNAGFAVIAPSNITDAQPRKRLQRLTNYYDLDGRTRIRYGTVDMGAYECICDGTIYKLW